MISLGHVRFNHAYKWIYAMLVFCLNQRLVGSMRWSYPVSTNGLWDLCDARILSQPTAAVGGVPRRMVRICV